MNKILIRGRRSRSIPRCRHQIQQQPEQLIIIILNILIVIDEKG